MQEIAVKSSLEDLLIQARTQEAKCREQVDSIRNEVAAWEAKVRDQEEAVAELEAQRTPLLVRLAKGDAKAKKELDALDGKCADAVQAAEAARAMPATLQASLQEALDALEEARQENNAAHSNVYTARLGNLLEEIEGLEEETKMHLEAAGLAMGRLILICRTLLDTREDCQAAGVLFHGAAERLEGIGRRIEDSRKGNALRVVTFGAGPVVSGMQDLLGGLRLVPMVKRPAGYPHVDYNRDASVDAKTVLRVAPLVVAP